MIVTGAASGIGRAVAARFADEGANVVAVDRNSEVEDLESESIVSVVGDTTTVDTNERAVSTAIDRWGRLDTFVGNVGVFDYFRPFTAYEPAGIADAADEFIRINITGQLIGARCALDAITASNGSIIFTGSGAGTHPNGGGVLYTATKHALHGAVHQLAAELAPRIRVNAVAPGGTRTSLSGIDLLGDGGRKLSDWAPLQNAMETGTPLGFLAEPDDHASIYVLLASPTESRAMTGAIIASDGGLSVRGRPRSDRPTTTRQQP